MKKRMKAMFCTLVIMLWITATAIPAFAAPSIKKAEYEGNGRVEVDFSSNVNYKNVKVTVTDTKGTRYTATINEKDSDDLIFTIANFKKGTTYKYTISGIKKTTESTYSSITGTIIIPSASARPVIDEIEYDPEDKELDIDFNTYVQWQNAKVTITYGSTNYVTSIAGKDNDSIELNVRALTYGRRYTYKISGIRISGNSTYTTISGTFVINSNSVIIQPNANEMFPGVTKRAK